MGYRRRFCAFVTKDSIRAPVIRHAMQFARDFLDAHTFGPRLEVKFAVIVEELVTNALMHGAGGSDFSLSLCVEVEGNAIQIAMEDSGVAFNPLTVPPVKGPDPETGGGIGLAIVHAWAIDANYERKDARNTLSLMLR